MGHFLKEQGSLDKTAAGKMMTAVGKAQSYSSQQRCVILLAKKCQEPALLSIIIHTACFKNTDIVYR